MAPVANRARFSLQVAGCEEELRVFHISGSEAVSALFDWSVEVVCRNPALKLEQLLACDALLQIDPGSGHLQTPRLVHGTVRAATQVGHTRRWTYYRLHLSPRLYWLGLRHNLRIFQNLSVPDILKQLLTEAGFDNAGYRFELKRDYRPRPYCVQYNESELNFIQRLLADEGIHYHFEHKEDRHVLVIADHGESFRPLQGSPFQLRSDVQMVGAPVILQFAPCRKVTVDAITRTDYDFRRPQHSLLSEARSTPSPRQEDYAWPGGHRDLDQGQRRVRDLLESHQVEQHQARGQSIISQLMSGACFHLEHHPNQAFNRNWLLLSLSHQGEQPQVLEEEAPDNLGGSYSNQFLAMPADLPYRPPMKAMRPHIRGIQTAIVVGPPGEQIYTDEHGRIQVRFHWDREGSPVWLRLVQGWAGAFWGSQILPRVGQEVIVSFLNGDPDQPVVSGCLYHGLNKPPYPLPDHKSRTLLRSQSLSGKAGHELMLEDASGQEKIAIHSARDLELHAARDETIAIGRHAHTHIAGHALSAIQGTEHRTVQGERRTRIDGNDSLTVDGALHLKASTNLYHQAGQEIHLKAGGNLFIDAGMELSISTGASSLSLNPGGVFLNGPAIHLNSGGSAGSAKGAAPKAPEPPVKIGDSKAGKAAAGMPNISSSDRTELAFRAITDKDEKGSDSGSSVSPQANHSPRATHEPDVKRLSPIPAQTGSAAGTATAAVETELSEPGFYIAHRPMTKEELVTQLYGSSSAVPARFEWLNPDLREHILPGEMIVLGDPNGMSCTQQEADLMEIAQQVNAEVRSLTPQEAQFVVDHYGLLELITSNASTGLGAGATMISQQIVAIEKTLRDIERLYQDTYRRYGHLHHSDFFTQRQQLFKRLDFALGSIARTGLSLDSNEKLKRALGLSSRSIVHHWSQAGVGEIPGYATHYQRIAKAAQYAKMGGYVAIGLDAAATGISIKEACTFGSEETCQTVTYKQYGRLSGSILGGIMGSKAAAGCTLLGVTGVGGIGCAIILGGLGSALGGVVGGNVGETFGEKIREIQVDE